VTRWWLVRHAPVVGQSGRIYGSNDVKADVSDETVFRKLAVNLPDDSVMVTSHLTRAIHTATAMIENGLRIEMHVVEKGLGEQDFGAWQGRTWEDISANDKAAGSHKFWTAPASHTPPGGESFHDVVVRVSRVMQRLTDQHSGRDIIAVIHGGSIRAALAHALALDPEIALGFATEYLSTTRIDHVSGDGAGGNWRVAFVNTRT
tara:strand:+ start:1189 stop:1800 length:612 start_codon:yes stop_codon:yes gene_type:complete